MNHFKMITSIKTGLILPLTLTLMLSACATSTTATTPGTPQTTTTIQTTMPTATDTSTPAQTQVSTQPQVTEPVTKPTSEALEPVTALELLQSIWNTFPESDRFPAAGGDFSEANATMNAPGVFSLDDLSIVDNVLGLPVDAGAQIDNAASLVHMMNANTFTAGAFHATDKTDAEELGNKLQENIQKRQWVCGFPEKLLILSVGDYTISAFGNGDLIEAFKKNTITAFSDAKVLVEEPVQ